MTNPIKFTRALIAGTTVAGAILFAGCAAEPAALRGLADTGFGQSATADPSAAGVSAGGPLSGAQLSRLRSCESGGNYRSVSSSGSFRGAYQFSRSTWNGVANRHLSAFVGVDPAAAPAIVQDAMAQALWGERGRSPWPVCGRRV